MSLFTTIKELVRPVLPIVKKHLPEVAITTGAILDGVSVIFACRETTIAQQLLNEKKPETFWEKCGIVVPAYWRTILTFAAGTSLIFFGNKLHLDRMAVMAGIAATQKDKLLAMAEETKKLVGPKKAQELQDKVETRNVDVRTLPTQNLPTVLGGDTLYVLGWNNWVFRSCPEQINELSNRILRDLIESKEMSLADVSEYFRVDDKFIGKDEHLKGWNTEDPPSIRTIWMDGPNGQPMGYLKMEPEPSMDYDGNPF